MKRPAAVWRHGARSIIRSMFAFALCQGQVQAENSALILAFGGEPGGPLPHAYNYGAPDTDAPTYTLRVRTVDTQVESVFYDSQLTISNPERIVQQVLAERAFDTLGNCENARAIIMEKLGKGLTREYTGADPRWQRQSEDGSIVGGAVCENPRYYPMPVLRLLIAINS